MSRYIHELPGWPGFRWDHKKLAGPLAALRHRQGRLIGRMETLGFSLRAEATLQTLTLDVLKSSEIEGEILDRDQVRSSMRGGWEWISAGLAPVDRNVEGVVEMMLDATQNYSAPLTAERLFRLACFAFPDRLYRYQKDRSWRGGAMMPRGQCKSFPDRSDGSVCIFKRRRQSVSRKR